MSKNDKTIGEIVDEAVEKGNYKVMEGGFVKVTVSDYRPGETIAEYMDRKMAEGDYEEVDDDLIEVQIPK